MQKIKNLLNQIAAFLQELAKDCPRETKW